MSDSIRSPIIAAEGQDILIFSSAGEAEEHLGRPPSTAGERLVFDARARVLKIDVATPPAGAPAAAPPRVRLSVMRPENIREEELIRLLQEYLQACGERVRPGTALSDLIRRCRSIQLYRE